MKVINKIERILFLMLVMVAIPLGIGSQEVDKTELESVKPAGLVFINYEGPVERDESLEAIVGIGRELGQAIGRGSKQAGSPYRYFVIHSVTAPEGAKLDADILGLGIDVGVNHIRNLREIIRGYLEGAYNYSPRDARLLAEFITIYNAVHRGNWQLFTERYKTAVVGHLTEEKAGLSVRYDQWPGQTLMLIPLSLAESGRLSAIDTSPLTDKKVMEEVKKQEDMGIATRKEMVDLKERESKEAEQKATVMREAIKDEEKRLETEKKAVQEREKQEAEGKQALEKEKALLEEAKKDENADSKEIAKKSEDIAAKEAALEKAEKETTARQEELVEDEKKLEADRETAAKEEALADKKASEAIEGRKEIAEDVQEQLDSAAEDKKQELLQGRLALSLLSANSSRARLSLINKTDGKELLKSGIDTIQGRSLVQLGGSVFGIAGEEGGPARLIGIDSEKLEITAQADEEMLLSSDIWVEGNNLYAIIKSEGRLYFARFNTALKRQARSSLPVHAWASPIFLGENLISIQNEEGQAILIKASDLTKN